MFIPVVNADPHEVSRAIWRLASPPGETTTQHYCAVVTHPETQVEYLDVPDNDFQPVHPQADATELAELIGESSLVDAIKAVRGQAVRVLDLIPQRFKEQALTEWPKPPPSDPLSNFETIQIEELGL